MIDKSLIRRGILAATVIMALSLVGCAMPHITVHEDPLSSQEHLKLGMSYEKGGEPELAESQYRMADDLPEAWLFLANLAYSQKKYGEACKLYDKAMRKLPDDPRPRNNLAWMLCEQGQKLDRAEDLARQAILLAEPGSQAQYQDTLEAVLKARKLQQQGK